MIKGQGAGQGLVFKDPDFRSIVGRPGDPFGPGDEHGGDGMTAGVSIGIGIGVQLSNQPDFKTGFFFGFPDGRGFQGFPIVHKPSGQGPAEGRIFPPDQDDLSLL